MSYPNVGEVVKHVPTGRIFPVKRRMRNTSDGQVLLLPESEGSGYLAEECQPYFERRTFFQKGDRVRYTGSNANFVKEYGSITLTIRRTLGTYANCYMPDGYISTWISMGELELVK